MNICLVIGVLLAAGAIGGAVNALISDNGFILPKPIQTPDGNTILRAGVLGNMVIGAVAAAVAWGLYGPSSGQLVIGAVASNGAADTVTLSVASLFTGVLIGVGGARWLTSEVDKRLLQAAASTAAQAQGSSSAARAIATATPAEALQLATAMPR